MMSTMDELMSGSGLRAPQLSVSPMAVFRAGKMPKLSMSVGRNLLATAIPDALAESGSTITAARLAGYTWHFINGATYGIAFTLLFGAGSWPLVIAWCTFIDLVMMTTMPPMMPMIKLPFPRFLVVPYFAHLAMALPIGYFAQVYITTHSIVSSSLFGSTLLSSGNQYFALTVLPIAAFVLLSAIIWLGCKLYTMPIYGRDLQW